MSKYLSYLTCIFVFISFNSCHKQTDELIQVEAEIVKEMEAESIPSVVACIIKEDQIVWKGAFGYAQIKNEIPASSQTIYTLMSISKLFIGVATMQLWEQGRIDLDADICQYLPFEVHNPKFPDDKITTSMLLNYTSGLAWPEDEDRIPAFYEFFDDDKTPLISEWLPNYILQGGESYKSAVWKNYRPGEKELYSNIATSLLALIVEQISGQDYRDYCREYILDPLEMHQSAYRFSELNENLLATPYIGITTPFKQFNYRIYPAGNLKSNIDDFSHFMIAILNYGEYKANRILKKSTIETMLTVQNPASGVSNIFRHCMGDCIGHSGGGTGFSTRAEWYFDRNMAMLIFTNKVNNLVYPQGSIYELVRYKANEFKD